MGIELGAAYLSILPETSKIAPGVKAALGDAGRGADRAGDESGKRFGTGFASAAGKLIGAAAGLAIGQKLVGGLMGALDQGQLNAKLGASLNLTEAQSAQAGKVAGQLYSQNYGDSMEQVNEGIRAVISNIDGMRGASTEALSDISGKALNTSAVFEQDLGGITRAVGQMMRTGMAKDASQALDIITVGFQSGADKVEDYLDTINEYGTQFRKMGLDGKAATGLIAQGLAAGARDGDKVADAIKEFSIRAIDGSKSTGAAFSTIGLDAGAMAAKIAKGGGSAKAGLQQVLDGLRAMKDPVAQEAAAVGLFGTQAEDLGKALYALDPGKAAAGLGQVGGAAKRASDQMSKTPAAQWESFKRTLEQTFVNVMGSKVIPKVSAFVDQMKSGEGPGGAFASAMDKAGSALSALGGFLQSYGAPLSAFVGIIGVAVGIAKAFAAAQVLINLAMSANPIGLIVVAIAGLVAGLVLAYKKSETFRAIVDAAFKGIKTVATAVFGAVSGVIKSAWGVISGVFKTVVPVLGTIVKTHFTIVKTVVTTIFNAVKSVISTVWGAIKGIITGGVRTVVGVIKGISAVIGIIRNAFNSAREAVSSAIGKIVSIVTGLPGKAAEALGDIGSYLKEKGSALIQGLIDGITSKIKAVGDAAGKIAGKIKGFFPGSPVKEGPLKSWNKGGAGKRLMNMLAQGITDGKSNVVEALGDVTASIEKALAVKYKGAALKKHTKAVLSGLKLEYAGIMLNAGRQLDNMKKLTAAREKYQAMWETAGSFAESLRGELDLTAGMSEPNEFGFGGGTTTFQSVQAAVQQVAARARTFATKLKGLAGAGIPRGLINEVAGLGSEKGIAVADAILSGSATQIAELKLDYTEFTNATDAAGIVLAEAWHEVGFQAQAGLIKGLESDAAAFDKVAKKLAKKLEKALRKELKIRSPSQRMEKRVGLQTGQGVGTGAIKGIEQMTPAVARSIDGLISAPRLPSPDDLVPSAAVGAGAGAGGGLDVDALVDALSSRPNVLTLTDRTAAELKLRQDRAIGALG